MKTRDYLSIFQYTTNGHEEVDGVYIYGFWKNELTIDKLEAIDQLTSFPNKCSWQIFMHNEVNKILCMSIHVIEYGNKSWLLTLDRILRAFVESGALISWVGEEFGSPSISEFLENGAIYAAYHPNIGFSCNSDLEEEFAYLTENQLKNYASQINYYI